MADSKWDHPQAQALRAAILGKRAVFARIPEYRKNNPSIQRLIISAIMQSYLIPKHCKHFLLPAIVRNLLRDRKTQIEIISEAGKGS